MDCLSRVAFGDRIWLAFMNLRGKWLSWEAAKAKTKKTGKVAACGLGYARKTGHWGQWASAYALWQKTDVAENRDHTAAWGLQPKDEKDTEKEERRKQGSGVRKVLRDFLGQSSLLNSTAGRCLLRFSKAVTPLTEVMLMINRLTFGGVGWPNDYKIQSLEIAKIYGTFYF